MTAVVTVPSGMNSQITGLLQTIATSFGSDINLADSTTFDMQLRCTDGQNISMKVTPLYQGFSVKVSPTSSLTVPASGGATLDGVYGTAVMVASTIDVTVTAPSDGEVAVPVGALVYATVTTPGGATKKLSAVRKDNSTITISSAGSGYANLLESAGVAGTNVAGTCTVSLANVAGDRLCVAEVSTGGTAADQRISRPLRGAASTPVG